MPSQPFSYQPYAQPYTQGIAQLMMAPAQIQGQALEDAARAHAAATAQGGNVWAKSFEATGQDLARPLATIASPEYQGAQLQLGQQRQRMAGLQIAKQLFAATPQGQAPDFGAIGQKVSAVDPELGMSFMSTAAQMAEAQQKIAGERLTTAQAQEALLDSAYQHVADTLKSQPNADPGVVLTPQLAYLQKAGVSPDLIQARFGPALSLTQDWGPTPTPQQRSAFLDALQSGLTPQQRTATASATTAEANASMAAIQANYMKSLQSGDTGPLAATVHAALGNNPALEKSTLAAMEGTMAMGGKGWDNAQTIFANALKANNSAQTAGPESAARATAVPGSEAQYVQNALTTAAKLKGSALTDAETKAVTDGSRTQFAIAGKDPLQRQAELSEVQLRNLMLQADQVPAATIDKIKTDLQRDPTLFAQATKGMNAIQMAQVRNSLPAGLLQNIDNSTHQMRLMAQEILPQIDTIQQEAQQLKDAGLTGLVGGHWRDLLAGKAGVAAAVANLNPQLSQLVGKFAADVGLLETAVAKAHGGARGGGSPEMLKHYETIMAPGGKDFNTFLGNLEGVKDWMSGYATLGMTTPDTKTPDLQTQTPDLIWDRASQSVKKPGGGS